VRLQVAGENTDGFRIGLEGIGRIEPQPLVLARGPIKVDQPQAILDASAEVPQPLERGIAGA
jgi:hypothetical protein